MYQFQTLEEREWFANAVETLSDDDVSAEERISLAKDLLRSQAFDNFLATKFQSVKRYGAEGGESMLGFFTEAFRKAAKGEPDNIHHITHNRGQNTTLILCSYQFDIF